MKFYSISFLKSPTAEYERIPLEKWYREVVKSWFDNFDDGGYAKYCSLFKDLNGKQLAQMTKEDFLLFTSQDPVGAVIFNALSSFKKDNLENSELLAKILQKYTFSKSYFFPRFIFLFVLTVISGFILFFSAALQILLQNFFYFLFFIFSFLKLLHFSVISIQFSSCLKYNYSSTLILCFCDNFILIFFFLFSRRIPSRRHS